MLVEINKSDDDELSEEFIMQNKPFEVGPFYDLGSGNLYIPSDDEGMGPYWTCITSRGTFWAYATVNLPIEGTCVSVDPDIKIDI